MSRNVVEHSLVLQTSSKGGWLWAIVGIGKLVRWQHVS